MSTESLGERAAEGCYDAPRAAALSGVPRSTVYWWARMGVVVPSVSPTQEKLWSYADLIALRLVSWLRHPKQLDERVDLPASPMPMVRQALRMLEGDAADVWLAGQPSPLLVDRKGDIFIRRDDTVMNIYGQQAVLSADHLDLTAPFGVDATGPDLLRPRPRLRIVPARVVGEPHVASTRITTRTLHALALDGYPNLQIAEMYGIDEAAVDDAIDLENQLSHDVLAA